MENSTNKMNIEKDAQVLKIYMFTIQAGPVKINLPEDFRTILAYNDTDALNMVLKEYQPGIQLFVRKRAQVEVQKIVDAVNFSSTTPQNLQIMVAPPEPREKTIQDFVYGMMFVADKFVTNKLDRASLKHILGKIKVHEDQSTPTTNENLA